MEACKLVTLLSNKVENNQTVQLFLTVKQSNLPLMNNIYFNTQKFEGGVKDLAIIINRITKPFKDAPKNECYLSVTLQSSEVIEFTFLAGKFSFSLNTIINSFVQRKLGGDNKNKMLYKHLKEDLTDILNEKINGFIKTLQFLQYVDKSPLYEITLGLTNLKLFSNEIETTENEA